jgi:hypothetical protein
VFEIGKGMAIIGDVATDDFWVAGELDDGALKALLALLLATEARMSNARE